EVIVSTTEENAFGNTRLNGVDGMGIYEGRKTEVIQLDKVIANKATNNARQIYSRISGLNIWESDCAGIQLGVGGRGLSPNRSSNFNTRQNGIDMSADALGYPESYYSPPMQALKSIQVVRGASSLQYGTQFGGLINFKIKEAPQDKLFVAESSITYGQYNYLNSFTSIGGTKNKWSYYSYFQIKSGDCWRCNSEFKAQNAYAKVTWKPNDKTKLSLDYSKLHYLAKQPGGVTDQQFLVNPQLSFRERNWFLVDWNLFSFNYDKQFSPYTSLNTRIFGLIASRKALGNLEAIDREDNDSFDRTLIDGNFKNIGAETRLLHRYTIGEKISSVLVGVRLYDGNSLNKDGLATKGKNPDFFYVKSDSLRYNYDNGGQNLALFAENIFTLTDKLSITPGVRYEYILTNSNGYYRKTIPTDLAGNPLIVDESELIEYSDLQNKRDFLLFGLGVSYKKSDFMEVYSNISQNYKSVSYSDIRITTPTLRVNPDITDEKGYTFDLGIRGSHANFFTYDITGFLLLYKNRIGTILMRDQDFRVYRYRSNIGNARNIGVESFIELDIIKWKNPLSKASLSLFTNFTYLHTKYIKAGEQIKGNKVEFSPTNNLRTGVTWKYLNWGATVQLSYLSDQFSDATNAPNNPPVPGAVEGTIPAYYVMDFSAQYKIKKWLKAEFSLNNFTNSMYFTRRATGYPGPGIIPSDGRNGHLTLTFQL
ncbi:MAG: TonB-dependent receptor, partial [Cyclobacteriaceae bacterium]|nr:TonB-dependent receptor [Cyclobacteriaceae bacterium]